MMSFLSSIGGALGGAAKTIGKGIGSFFGSGAGIGTLVGTGASLLGNILSNNSQSSANKQNLQIAQMNNAFNERMLEKAMRYNSASEQAKRFREAGLNPALMMQGQGAGQASATTAAASPEIRPQNWDFSSIGNAIQAGVQSWKNNQMMDEQIQGVRIENQYKRQQIIQQLAKLKEEELSTRTKRQIDEKIRDNLDRQQTAEYETELARRDDLRSQIDKRTAEIMLLNKNIAKFDARFDYEKALAVAHTLRLASQRDLDYEQMRKEVYNTIISEYQAKREKLDYDTAKRIADNIVEQSDWETSYKPVGDVLNDIFGTARAAQDFMPRNSSRGKVKSVYSVNGSKFYQYY